jgi:hypothetical protein
MPATVLHGRFAMNFLSALRFGFGTLDAATLLIARGPGPPSSWHMRRYSPILFRRVISWRPSPATGFPELH